MKAASALLLLALAVSRHGAAAGPQLAQVPANSAATVTARLDQLLAERKYGELREALTDTSDLAAFKASLDWSQQKTMQGTVMLVPFWYGLNLWRVGSSPQYANLRDTAVLIFFHTASVMIADAPSCADPSAFGGRWPQFLEFYKPVLGYARTLAPAALDAMRTTAFRMEESTVSKRPPDYVLCSGGLENLDMSSPGTPAPARPGQLGQQMQHPSKPIETVRFRDEADWRPKQAEARRTLPDLLRKFPG